MNAFGKPHDNEALKNLEITVYIWKNIPPNYYADGFKESKTKL